MPFQAWIHSHAVSILTVIAKLQWGHALSGMDTCPADEPTHRVLIELQWGHALSGMDTHNKEKKTDGLQIASMGPCPFRHGYENRRPLVRDSSTLQWGHALSGMDTTGG